MSNGVTSFLFQGAPVPAQPSSTDASTSFPLWQQQYVYNLANAATNLAQTPYTPFPGPQVAAPSGATTQAQNMALGNVGNWSPALSTAQGLTSQAATPLSPGQIANYTNPAEQSVIGGITSALNTNLFQNVLPQVQSQFVSAGQAASPQQMQATNNAVYQNQQAIGQSVGSALNTSYGQALSAAQQQQALTNAAGAQYGQLGALGQQLSAADTGQVAAVGQAQDTLNQANINAAMSNFNAQQQWPYQNLGFAADVLQGQALPTTTQTVSQPSSTTYSPSPLSSFIGTSILGSQLGNSLGTSASNSSLASLLAGGATATGGHITRRKVAARGRRRLAALSADLAEAA